MLASVGIKLASGAATTFCANKMLGNKCFLVIIIVFFIVVTVVTFKAHFLYVGDSLILGFSYLSISGANSANLVF